MRTFILQMVLNLNEETLANVPTPDAWDWFDLIDLADDESVHVSVVSMEETP